MVVQASAQQLRSNEMKMKKTQLGGYAPASAQGGDGPGGPGRFTVSIIFSSGAKETISATVIYSEIIDEGGPDSGPELGNPGR